MHTAWGGFVVAWVLALGLTLAGWPCAVDAAEPARVDVPSLDRQAGSDVVLPGFWFPVASPPGATAPALVMFHGCGGLFDSRGRLATRYTELAARLNALGIQALATDSFTPRGEKELCTQRNGSRRITQTERRRDALGALRWLAAQPGVDAARLGFLGWSNGGSTVLAATNQRHPDVAGAPVKPTLAVAFYPGCEAELQRGYTPAAPLLMLLGEADDWTPAAPCKALAAQASATIQWEAYAGAYHGFDGTTPVRLRADVPNGAHPGQGVHVGADPAAREASTLRLAQFIRETWKLP
jgi:dienelactone hydrolase